MKVGITLLLLWSASLVSASEKNPVKEVSVRYQDLSYSIVQTKEKFKFTHQGNTLSFDIKKCNKTIFEMIWARINVAKKDFTSTLAGNTKNSILFSEGNKTSKLLASSKLGTHLINMPQSLQNLEFEVFNACKK